MGVLTAKRAFSDAYIYMAYNERHQITPDSVSYPCPLSRFLGGFSIIKAVFINMVCESEFSFCILKIPIYNFLHTLSNLRLSCGDFERL